MYVLEMTPDFNLNSVNLAEFFTHFCVCCGQYATAVNVHAMLTFQFLRYFANILGKLTHT